MDPQILSIDSKHKKEQSVTAHEWVVNCTFIEGEGLSNKEIEAAVEEAVKDLGDSE
jgi:hypothetical protein